MRNDVTKTLDKWGIIGQPGWRKELKVTDIEGGDSINRMGHYFFLVQANKDVLDAHYTIPYGFHTKKWAKETITVFEKEWGQFVRHPEPQASRYGWASYQKGLFHGNMSRDQLKPTLIWMGYFKLYKPAFRMLVKYIQRGFIFTNRTIKNNTNPNSKNPKDKILPDLVGPEEWAAWIRLFRLWPLYPLLCIFDLSTVASSLVWRFVSKDDDDVINHCSYCIYTMLVMPTPTSWLACKINKKKDMAERLYSYWSGWRGSGYFFDLYIGLTNKYFGD